MAIKIGDRVKLIDRVKRYVSGADKDGWFTIERENEYGGSWWYLEETDGGPFRENEMIKAKKPTIIII